jgi:arylsulfatase A-like enzyme
MVGEFMKTLEAEGLLENTLIIFTSDNGPVLNDGYYDDAVKKLGNHTPAGPLRGGKYSLFEAGTRVPFMVYWKGKLQPQVSDALVSQVDFLASLAALTGSSETSEDSQNLLPAFFGKEKVGRSNLILEATGRTALRKGEWIMIPPYKGVAKLESVNIEIGNDPNYQLYNLTNDIGQTTNLANTNPEKLEEMIADYTSIRGGMEAKIEDVVLK